MHRNVLLVLTLVMLATATLPTSSAAEVDTQPYVPSWGLQFGTLSFGVHIPPTFGGTELSVPNQWPTVVVAPADNYFGMNVPLTVCEGSQAFVWGSVPPTCTAGCGPQALGFSSGSGDRVTTFVHWIGITQSLDVCFGVEGTVTGSFS